MKLLHTRDSRDSWDSGVSRDSWDSGVSRDSWDSRGGESDE